MTELIHDAVFWLARTLEMEPFEIRGPIAVLLVSLICGMVGSMVVGSRMAFFSDAMAHCAFAGVALGLIITIWTDTASGAPLTGWFVPLIMVTFSALVGSGIAFVKQKSSLATDTVIGVFFAGAIGFGALMLTAIRQRTRFDPETFIFGNPWVVSDVNLLYLLLLLVVTFGILWWRHNDLVFGSVNESLGRSRGIPIERDSYVFIILLALVVNFSIIAVGVLLINGLLIVPAAVAANLARNLRQMFWLTVGVGVGSGMVGLWLSEVIRVPVGVGEGVQPGPSGPILVTCVSAFFLSMALPPLLRRTKTLLLGQRSESVSRS